MPKGIYDHSNQAFVAHIITSANWADPAWRARQSGLIAEGRKVGKKVDNRKYKNLATTGHDRLFDRYLYVRYGITLAEYRELERKQNGACAFCSRKPKSRRLHLDHDHSTSRVRGLLCYPCNRALGVLEKNVDKVVEYLRQEVTSSRDD